MEKELCACRYCKCKAAETFKVEGLYYVRCKGTRKVTKTLKKNGEPYKVIETKKCNAWAPYEFLGITEQAAIDNWNDRNSGRQTEEE